MRLLEIFLPAKFFYGDRLTHSARRLLLRVGVGIVGVVAAAVALGLLTQENWAEVLSGALFAWAVALLVWAVNSYRTATSDSDDELRRMAELDLLHARLNHVSAHLGLPLLNLHAQIDSVLEARKERLAHFAGLDEFRPRGPLSGAEWWDSIALGIPDEATDELPGEEERQH